jgi:hypothetical protein
MRTESFTVRAGGGMIFIDRRALELSVRRIVVRRCAMSENYRVHT